MNFPTEQTAPHVTADGSDGGQVLGAVDRLKEMPMMPAVAIEAMQLAEDPEASALDLANLIEQDMTLATEILRVANSSLYGFSTPADSVNRAVVRLGVKGCQNLVLVAGMSSLMRKFSLRQEWMREVIWRHSVLAGMICRQLNRLFQMGFHGEEFTAGLVHDIGRLLLAVVAETSVELADPFDFHEPPEILEMEAKVLGTDHCQVGDLFARRNHLPETIREVIRCHHTLEKAKLNPSLVALVMAADHMANYHQRTSDVADYNPEESPGMMAILTKQTHSASEFHDLLPIVMQEAVSRCRDFCHP